MSGRAATAVIGAQPSPGKSDKAEVFISYSRYEPGDRPDSDADPAAARRWRARTLARDLVGVVEKTTNGRGYQAWRDTSALTAGDPFAHAIDVALLSCVGAVILLDPDGLERSEWVRWESAILTWRQRIDMPIPVVPERVVPVRVVPVLIGLAAEELDKHGYGPSRLERTLAYSIDPATMDPDSADYRSELDEHARQIVGALGDLDGEPKGSISVWVKGIADCLPANCDSWRGEVEDKLSHGERLRLSARPERVVARELLAADRVRFMRIMDALSNFPFRDRPLLKQHLKPVWVPAAAATGIAEAKERPPGKRIIVVNASEAGTGTDVVRRAIPGSGYRRLEWTSTAVTVDDAVSAVKRAITRKWPDPCQDAEDFGGFFVVVSCNGCPSADLARIVTDLASAYPSLTYVVMAGDTQLQQYQWLQPALAADADRKARQFHAALDDFIFISPG